MYIADQDALRGFRAGEPTVTFSSPSLRPAPPRGARSRRAASEGQGRTRTLRGVEREEVEQAAVDHRAAVEIDFGRTAEFVRVSQTRIWLVTFVCFPSTPWDEPGDTFTPM